MTVQLRYPLHLTSEQLDALKRLLDTASASEADPDAEVFTLLDLVREARRHCAQVQKTEGN